jgi:hypothetical protein
MGTPATRVSMPMQRLMASGSAAGRPPSTSTMPFDLLSGKIVQLSTAL